MFATGLNSVPSDGDRTNRGGITSLNLKEGKLGDEVAFQGFRQDIFTGVGEGHVSEGVGAWLLE